MSTFNKYRTKGAYHYDWYETEPWYKACVDEIVGFCGDADDDVVDIGCGDGLLSYKLAEKGHQVWGIDSDPDAIRLAKDYQEKNGKDLKHYVCYAQRALNEEWVVAEFEYLACLNVIEHLDNPEELKEFISKYVTKGAIIMTLDWQGGAFGEDHRKEYTLPELEEFFQEFKPKPFRIKDYPEWIGVKIKL